MYKYTALNQDGSIKILDTCEKKWDYTKIKNYIGNYIEYIPSGYFPKGMAGQVIGDEEAKLRAGNYKNPHMITVLGSYTAGDLLLEQTVRQNNKWLQARKELKI